MGKIISPLFPKIKKVSKRNWGEEILLTLIPKKISLKLLKIKKIKKADYNIIDVKMNVD